MASLCESVLIQTVLCLLITICNISEAQFSDVRHSDYRNWPIAAQKNPYKSGSKVSLIIYYETHCPYTERFFKNQLAPTVERLASHLDVYMIPYGHAKTIFENGQYTFYCQHGDIECYGNKLHACAIDVIQSKTLATIFNICMIDRSYDYNKLNDLVYMCGRKLNIQTNGIWECMNSERSSILMKRHGDETRMVRPTHIPFVVLNGSADDQGIITQYLGYSVCRLLNPQPQICRTT